MTESDYCELCDLPKSQCIHGLPPAEQPATKRAAPKPQPKRRKVTQRAATRTTVRRWTPPEAFRPGIVAVLEEAGGELEAEDVFRELEQRLAGTLSSADHEKTPEGELRWQYAARRARQSLIADGVMTTGRPGVWSLSRHR